MVHIFNGSITKKRETKKKALYPVIHSSNGHNIQSWADLKSQELRASSRSPMCIQGPKHLSHPLLASQALSRQLLSVVEPLEYKPLLIQDASIAGKGLAH